MGFEGQKSACYAGFCRVLLKKAIKSRRWRRRAVFCRFSFKYSLNNARSLQNRLFWLHLPCFHTVLRSFCVFSLFSARICTAFGVDLRSFRCGFSWLLHAFTHKCLDPGERPVLFVPWRLLFPIFVPKSAFLTVFHQFFAAKIGTQVQITEDKAGQKHKLIPIESKKHQKT